MQQITVLLLTRFFFCLLSVFKPINSTLVWPLVLLAFSGIVVLASSTHFCSFWPYWFCLLLNIIHTPIRCPLVALFSLSLRVFLLVCRPLFFLPKPIVDMCVNEPRSLPIGALIYLLFVSPLATMCHRTHPHQFRVFTHLRPCVYGCCAWTYVFLTFLHILRSC